ncbi:MAG: Fur family transcriptional regulator [Arachnia sp.]
MTNSATVLPTSEAHTSAVETLRRKGVRITASRLAVLTAVRESPHSDADTVAHMVRDRLGAISTQAIYDALALFTRLGLLRRIQPSGSSALYETRVGDNHHHVVCRGCGLIVDVDCPVEAPPCLNPVATHGFIIDEAEVLHWGVCPSCQRPPT